VKRIRVWLAAAVALLAIAETGNALWAPHRRASERDWTDAAARVRANFRDGDLIVFAPDWVDQIGRAQLGDLMPLEMVGRSDSARYGRIWELSIRGAHAPETKSLARVEGSVHGRVTVTLFSQTPTAIAWDSTSHFADARVTQAPGETPCPRSPTGFRCATTLVEPRTLEIDYRPRRGLLVPLEQSKTTRVEWSDVPVGAFLVGWVGLHDYYARKSSDAPVELALFVDGRAALTVPVANADGWKRFALPGDGGTHTIRVEISGRSAPWRNVGFHLEARK
jgi:hypothetical protein